MSWDDYISRIREIRREIPLKILIWGPGKGQPGYDKRVEIKNRIKHDFPSTEVKFSEDFRDIEYDELWAQEVEQALSADLVLILALSLGPVIEACISKLVSSIASKIFVLIPEEYKDKESFAAQMIRTLRVCYFTPQDLKSCNLIEKACKRVRTVQMRKLIGLY